MIVLLVFLLMHIICNKKKRENLPNILKNFTNNTNYTIIFRNDILSKLYFNVGHGAYWLSEYNLQPLIVIYEGYLKKNQYILYKKRFMCFYYGTILS